MDLKWNELSGTAKKWSKIRIVVSCCMIVLIYLGGSGTWKEASDLNGVLLGVILFVETIFQWRQKRKQQEKMKKSTICFSIFFIMFSIFMLVVSAIRFWVNISC